MYERGLQKIDGKPARTNMIFATIAAMMPELYAKNPTIGCSPTDAVTAQEMGKVKKFCATAEKVIRNMLVEEGKLKKRAKANIRAACATGYGVLKVIYQKEYRGDPIAVRRIEDTQDNLARVEALVEQIRKADDLAELAKKRDELKANLQALASGNEIKIFKGFVVDRMKSEDFVVLDDNVAEFDEYADADALGHKIWLTVGSARELFRMEPHGATKYGQPRTDANQKTDDTPADQQFICVVEIWDKKNGVVRTTAKGMNRWLREPYTPQCTPQRWYPFYVLGFNLTEGEWRPISDVELLKELQDEYDRTRQNYADVREKAVPVLVFRKSGGLTEEDIKALTDRKNKDTIGVEGAPTVPLAQDIIFFAGAKIDPQAYDVSMIRNDMDLVSGRSDASRANLIKPKTATEAEIMQEAMQSRVAERRDTHEDLLSDMGEAALEVALRDLTKDEVKQIAGADAEWPEEPGQRRHHLQDGEGEGARRIQRPAEHAARARAVDAAPADDQGNDAGRGRAAHGRQLRPGRGAARAHCARRCGASTSTSTSTRSSRRPRRTRTGSRSRTRRPRPSSCSSSRSSPNARRTSPSARRSSPRRSRARR
jgi:hypothetical protein